MKNRGHETYKQKCERWAATINAHEYNQQIPINAKVGVRGIIVSDLSNERALLDVDGTPISQFDGRVSSKMMQQRELRKRMAAERFEQLSGEILGKMEAAPQQHFSRADICRMMKMRGTLLEHTLRKMLESRMIVRQRVDRIRNDKATIVYFVPKKKRKAFNHE